MVTFKKTEVEDIEMGMDNAGKIASLLFYSAKNRILTTLSDEGSAKRNDEAMVRVKAPFGSGATSRSPAGHVGNIRLSI
ncbi:12449_t:CDS:2, partial [Ambispora leptoticha]